MLLELVLSWTKDVIWLRLQNFSTRNYFVSQTLQNLGLLYYECFLRRSYKLSSHSILLNQVFVCSAFSLHFATQRFGLSTVCRTKGCLFIMLFLKSYLMALYQYERYRGLILPMLRYLKSVVTSRSFGQ